jgi:DNA modification methylase
MNKVFFGDCRESMRELTAQGVRVQTCVTSPPYYGLRDYGHPGQLGLEPTPDEYVSNMVEVFRCVRDLLADDGTLWLNLGDSYASIGRSARKESPGVGAKQEMAGVDRKVKWGSGGGTNFHWSIPAFGTHIKQKDLIGIPWRVAFALQADGWYLRQDIIWHKPNPMPESVTDRCTKAHEYIFLLSKSARYYYDSAAISEDFVGPKYEGSPTNGAIQNGDRADKGRTIGMTTERRNKRSVWTVSTKPYSGAHFATFPPELIEPCILAGAPAGGIVLDPFFGSGTTGQVCQQLGRQWIGCELNPAYEDLQLERTRQNGLEFA